MTVLVVVALLSCGLLAGAQLVMAIAIAPAMQALPSKSYVALHQLIDPRMDPAMPAIGGTAIVSTATLAVLADAPATIAFAVAALLTGGVGYVSARVNKPINTQVINWDPEALPACVERMRNRWIRANMLRSICSGLAFVVTTAGVVLHLG